MERQETLPTKVAKVRHKRLPPCHEDVDNWHAREALRRHRTCRAKVDACAVDEDMIG
jgi:hypothetical protein